MNEAQRRSVFTTSSPSFDAIYEHLGTTYAPPLLPPSTSSLKPHDTALTDTIASLQVHPALEACLHILNCDLPSAHFLLRHMPSGPAFEGMFLHGILHRIETDFDNARAWYWDVRESDVYRRVWGLGEDASKEVGGEGGMKDKLRRAREEGKSGRDKGQEFVDRVEALRKKGEGDEAELRRESGEEIAKVVEWCREKFGTGKWVDGTAAWFKPGEADRKMGEDMVSGNRGMRNF